MINNKELKRTEATTMEDSIKIVGWKNIDHILKREKQNNTKIASIWAAEGNRNWG